MNYVTLLRIAHMSRIMFPIIVAAVLAAFVLLFTQSISSGVFAVVLMLGVILGAATWSAWVTVLGE